MKIIYLIKKLTNKLLLLLLNKTPNWLKYIFYYSVIVTFLFLFKFYTGHDVDEYIFNPLIWKYLILFFVVYCLFVIFDNLASLYICFSKTKISYPNYTPKFIVKWYNTSYKISRSGQKDFFIKLYLRNIFTDILLLIIAIIGLLILM